jgi:DNA polymerase-3 subunit delta
VKAAKGGIGRAVDQPDPAVRFYLLHGPDEAGSRGLADRLLKGTGATRFVISGGAVKSDPASLADEAGAMSLFGERRLIWVEPAGDDIAAGVEALLASPACESPVAAIAGALRKTSALLKLAEAHKAALAHASYVPEGKDAERMVVDLGRAHGLRMAPGVAARLASASGNDQAVASQEVAKLALYLDAAPERPRELDHDALDAVAADTPEGDWMRLADLALSGELGSLVAELGRLSPGGTEAIPVVRSLQRRLLMLAPIRARVERGERVDAVLAAMGKSLFWKDKELVSGLLRKWDAAGLATLTARSGRLERDLVLTRAPAAESLGHELIAIAREARRR